MPAVRCCQTSAHPYSRVFRAQQPRVSSLASVESGAATQRGPLLFLVGRNVITSSCRTAELEVEAEGLCCAEGAS